MQRLINRVRNLPEHLRFKYAPRIVRWLVRASTMQACRRLPTDNPLKILVDNTVLGNAVTHETAWISTGPKMWGPHEINTGYSARVPVHSADNDSELYRNVTYLAGIADLGTNGHLKMYTSAELKQETYRQPGGRFRGYGYSDYNVFGGVKLECIDRLEGGFVMASSIFKGPSCEEQQLRRVNSSLDPLFKALVKRLGQKQSLDAWHIKTAETHGMFCFLTMDFKLRRSVERWKDHEPFKSLNTRIMTPEEFGKEFGIAPLPPHLHSYNDASFPVRPDLHMPGEKRRPVSAYRKK